MEPPLSVSIDRTVLGFTRPFTSLLKGKWTVDILCVLVNAPVRLGALKRHIPAASKKALTASLRSLEQAGLVTRLDLSTSRLHVQYELVESKREVIRRLMKLLEELSVTFQ